MDLLPRALRRPRPLRLVVGLNRADEVVPGGWDTRLNRPGARAVREIDRRCEDAARLLAAATGIGRDHIEHYSALRRYRLPDLLHRVIRHCHAGFGPGQVQPLHPEDVAGVDPEARTLVKQERAARLRRRGPDASALLAELSRILGPGDLRLVEGKLAAEPRRPPRVAVLGRPGVGRATTVNALFATEWRLGPAEAHAGHRRVPLPGGGVIDVLDLPGPGGPLGRCHDLVAAADLVLLIVPAVDPSGDREMILKLKKVAEGAPAGALAAER